MVGKFWWVFFELAADIQPIVTQQIDTYCSYIEKQKNMPIYPCKKYLMGTNG
jgi:hypothetical protein